MERTSEERKKKQLETLKSKIFTNLHILQILEILAPPGRQCEEPCSPPCQAVQVLPESFEVFVLKTQNMNASTRVKLFTQRPAHNCLVLVVHAAAPETTPTGVLV